VHDVSCPGRTGMHYMTRRSPGMQNHRVSVTCAGVLFMKTTPGPPMQRKIVRRCFAHRAYLNALRDLQISSDAKTQVQRNVSRHAFFWNPYRWQPSMKIVHRRFMPLTHRNALHDPQIPPDAKKLVRCNVPRRIFYENHT
jgi:hypothetical protein